MVFGGLKLIYHLSDIIAKGGYLLCCAVVINSEDMIGFGHKLQVWRQSKAKLRLIFAPMVFIDVTYENEYGFFI